MLLSKIVRTEFESKSQLIRHDSCTVEGCYQRSLEQSLKANHNWSITHGNKHFVVIKDR